jgi:multicomponent Na+:H+ antiporter subunit G
MTPADVAAAALLGSGAFFFLAGTVGLLRFPDVLCRLHALTKADNLGLGLVLMGLMVRSGSMTTSAKLGVIWLLVLLASTTACHLVARAAVQQGITPGRRP